ncbi:MAG: pyruvate kinase alpha/beta domain-containing protein [Candidatus Bathyarchaeia archaeon]
MKTISKVWYFEEPGPENTEYVIQAVSEKIKEKGIKTVIVASTSGDTALKFAKYLKNKAKLIAVSWKKITQKNVQELQNLDVTICNFENYLPLHEMGNELVRNTFYTFGQGIKVCAEVTLIAVDKGIIPSGQEVIAVGGTGSGADSAAIIKATSTSDMFSSDIQKRLEIREIIAMPRKKKWWK